jgi:uncharacterized protein YlxP (DUF503 family)
MIVGLGVLELHLPHAHDLKAKRRVVRSLVERLHARFRISAAETAWHDLHQRAEIGVALVARDAAEAERMLDEVLRLAELETEAEVADWSPQILEEEA